MTEDRQTKRAEPSRDREVVLLIHGLMRTRASLRPLDRAFTRAGYAVERWGYASSRADIQSHVRALEPVFARLAARYDRVHCVTHSLGGLIVRGLLRAYGTPAKLGRLVLIAPPNRGSLIAHRLLRLPGLRALYGPSGLDVGEPVVVEQLCAIPEVPFLIVAGTRAFDLRNPTSWIGRRLLVAPHDGTVTVEETRLPGAAGLMQVDETHTFLASHPDVIRAAVAFISAGEVPDGAR